MLLRWPVELPSGRYVAHHHLLADEVATTTRCNARVTLDDNPIILLIIIKHKESSQVTYPWASAVKCPP